jgi:hypothetical protein
MRAVIGGGFGLSLAARNRGGRRHAAWLACRYSHSTGCTKAADAAPPRRRSLRFFYAATDGDVLDAIESPEPEIVPSMRTHGIYQIRPRDTRAATVVAS